MASVRSTFQECSNVTISAAKSTTNREYVNVLLQYFPFVNALVEIARGLVLNIPNRMNVMGFWSVNTERAPWLFGAFPICLLIDLYLTCLDNEVADIISFRPLERHENSNFIANVISIDDLATWVIIASAGMLLVFCYRNIPGPLFTKTPSYQYRDYHYKPETVVRPSYRFIMGIPIPVRDVFLVNRGPSTQNNKRWIYRCLIIQIICIDSHTHSLPYRKLPCKFFQCSPW